MRKIAVANTKGGVGKSFVANNLALRCAARGISVCFVDLDEACPFSYLNSPKASVGDGESASLQILDLPPNPAADLFEQIDTLLVVTTPEPASLVGAVRTVRSALAAKQAINILVVANKCRSQRVGRAVVRRVETTLAKHLSIQVAFSTIIMESPAARDATMRRVLLAEKSPKCQLARTLDEILNEVTRQPESQAVQFLTTWRGEEGGGLQKAA